MIESKNDASRNLEKALQELEQAKQRVANEKKKQNEKKRKAENHHKYIMGGIIVKYFPDCYRYDEDKLNRILSVALQTRECQQIISKIKSESRSFFHALGVSFFIAASLPIFSFIVYMLFSAIPSSETAFTAPSSFASFTS